MGDDFTVQVTEQTVTVQPQAGMARADADAIYIPLAQKAAASGVATLDADGVLTAAQRGGSLPFQKQTIVPLGDSITANNFITDKFYASGYLNQANARLGQRFVQLANAGVSGNRTDQMLARIDDDVLAHSPGYVLVQGGGNDVGQGKAATTIETNLEAIYAKSIAAGCVVIATTITPSTSFDTAAEKTVLYAVNQWIRQQAQATRGIILCDWFGAVANPSTGAPATNMMSDGTHPTQTGGYYLGQALYNTLESLTYPADPLPFSNVENASALPNPMMVGDTSGVATSITIGGGGTGTITKTKVARTDGIQGEWQQLVIASGTVYVYLNQQVDVSDGYFNVGDRVYGTVEVEIDSGATMMGLNGEVPVAAWLLNQDATSSPSAYDLFAGSGEGSYPGPIPTGRMVLRTPNYLIPDTGSDRLFMRAQIQVNGTVRVGRMQLYKATSTTSYGN